MTKFWPNGSLPVKLSYEVEMGALEPEHQLQRQRELVDEVGVLYVSHRVRGENNEYLERLIERIKEWDSGLVMACEEALAEEAING